MCREAQLGHFLAATAAAKSLQSCPTLWDPTDGSPPGSAVPEILQARTLAWVAISFSNAWKWKVEVKSLSRVWLLATPCPAAYQAPPSMGFSRQAYWSGVPLPSLGRFLGKSWCSVKWLLGVRMCVCFMGKDSFILIGTSNNNVMIIKFEKYTWNLLSGFRRQQANGKSVLALEKPTS